MANKRKLLISFLCLAAFGLPACRGGKMTAGSMDNPTPSVGSVAPASASAGGSAFTLTVAGSGFVSGSVVQWNGSNRVTTFVSSTQLTAGILASDIAAGGTANVAVVNPAPGGGTSLALVFNINNPMPAITMLTPSSATAGGAAFALTVDGTGFVSGSAVQWNGSSRATTVVNSTQLRGDILSSDIAMSGMANVTVVNPAPGGGASGPSPFTIIAPPQPAGVLERVSVATDGSQIVLASGVSVTGVSADARYVAFFTDSPNLVPGDNNIVPGFGGTGFDVFIRDTCRGAMGCTPSTQRVSVADDGSEIPSGLQPLAGQGLTTSDARFVVFLTHQALVPSDMDGGKSDVYVRDTCIGAAGCTPRTILASEAFDTPVPEQGTVLNQFGISADGRFVAFSAFSFQRGQFEVFVRDLTLNITTVASVANDQSASNGRSDSPSVSADGRYVAFASDATNLVSGDTNGVRDYFVRDTLLQTTTLVSVATDGTQQNMMGGCCFMSISSSGRYVAFVSDANNLVAGDTNNQRDTFVRDTCAGAPGGCTPSTIRVSVSSTGAQAGNGGDLTAWTQGSISADGRFVVFASFSPLVPNDFNNQNDTYIRDTCAGAAGCTPTTVRVSISGAGVQGNNSSWPGVITPDGRFVAFDSDATNLVSGDTNTRRDTFLGRTGF